MLRSGEAQTEIHFQRRSFVPQTIAHDSLYLFSFFFFLINHTLLQCRAEHYKYNATSSGSTVPTKLRKSPYKRHIHCKMRHSFSNLLKVKISLYPIITLKSGAHLLFHSAGVSVEGNTMYQKINFGI